MYIPFLKIDEMIEGFIRFYLLLHVKEQCGK